MRGAGAARLSLSSFISLAGLIVLVFFLARLTGDPANLVLGLDRETQFAVEADAGGRRRGVM
jgi:hypothetical protein